MTDSHTFYLFKDCAFKTIESLVGTFQINCREKILKILNNITLNMYKFPVLLYAKKTAKIFRAPPLTSNCVELVARTSLVFYLHREGSAVLFLILADILTFPFQPLCLKSRRFCVLEINAST
jgi:hypothetical protein